MATTGVKVVIVGLAELRDKLDRLDDETAGSILQNAVRAGGLIIQNSAKEKAPVKSGNLRRSIHMEDAPGISRDRAGVTVGTDVEYAPYVEFGTSRMSAQPYLRPALDENEDRVGDVIGAVLRAQIARIT